MALIKTLVFVVVLKLVYAQEEYNEVQNEIEDYNVKLRRPFMRARDNGMKIRRRPVAPNNGLEDRRTMVYDQPPPLKMPQYEREYKPNAQPSSYTVHGVKDADAKMSPDVRSKGGCMTTMKRSNANKDGKMTEQEMETSCEMYMEWGKNMREKPSWKPTEDQRKWWDSLGLENRMHYYGTRDKRQRVPRQSGGDKAVRKEYRMMTDKERQDFHEAMNSMKNDVMDGVSKYDVFVNYHQANVAPGAHFGPGFYGFHRELLFRFENALREINPTVSLPYWDSNLDNHLGDELAQVSILWSNDFFGNGKGDVTSGPFAYWSIPNPVRGRWVLHRNLTVAPPNARTEPALIPDEAIEFITNAESLRDLAWFVDTTFESHHGATHNWVGGVMGDLPNSPADPVFFLHHVFIDCLWEQMRTRQRQRQPSIDPQYDYPNDSIALGVGIVQPDGELLTREENSAHYALNTMEPFGPLRNIDGLRNEYFDEFYTCAPSPRCSSSQPDCGSPYLFCDQESNRCAPKLQLGEPCSKFADADPCHKGTCCNGRCLVTCPTRTTLTSDAPQPYPTLNLNSASENDNPISDSGNQGEDARDSISSIPPVPTVPVPRPTLPLPRQQPTPGFSTGRPRPQPTFSPDPRQRNDFQGTFGNDPFFRDAFGGFGDPNFRFRNNFFPFDNFFFNRYRPFR